MDIEEITSGTMNSPSDLIDLEESLFATRKDEQGPPRAWAFRGQPRGYKTLVPSFQRIFTGKKSVRTSQIIEQDLIAAFRLHYKDLRGRTTDMPVPPQIAEGFDLRCLSVMQHYGVPTRLLDGGLLCLCRGPWSGCGALVLQPEHFSLAEFIAWRVSGHCYSCSGLPPAAAARAPIAVCAG